MSVIGPGSLGAIHLAGSAAGSQRTQAGDDDVKASAADRKMQADRDRQAAASHEDVAEADLMSERDADGRLPWSYEEEDLQQDSASEEGGSGGSGRRRKTSDAFGERGTRLDLEV